MTLARQTSVLAIALLGIAFGALAQQSTPSAQKHDQHHPGGSAAAPAQTAPTGPDAQMGSPQTGAMMMPMMGGMMPMMGGGMMRGGAGQMPMMMRMADHMAKHIEGRLAFLKTELKIADAQSGAWEAFANAVRENAKAMKAVHPAASDAAATNLPDRIERHEKALAAHLEALRRLKSAIGPLYTALTDEQKKLADELMIGPMGFVMM